MKISRAMHLTYMKYPVMLATSLLLLAAGLKAQSKGDRLYGYKQPVLPGAAAAKRITDDAGHVVERDARDVSFNYYIYLATSAKTRVYPVEMWIKGEPFSATPQPVSSTPVHITTNVVMGQPQETELVPKTTQKITRLDRAPFIAEKSSAKAATLARNNELVVVYRQGGKTFIKALKTLSALSPRAMQ